MSGTRRTFQDLEARAGVKGRGGEEGIGAVIWLMVLPHGERGGGGEKKITVCCCCCLPDQTAATANLLNVGLLYAQPKLFLLLLFCLSLYEMKTLLFHVLDICMCEREAVWSGRIEPERQQDSKERRKEMMATMKVDGDF